MQYLAGLLCLLYVTSYGQCRIASSDGAVKKDSIHVTPPQIDGNGDNAGEFNQKRNLLNVSDRSSIEASIYHLYNNIGLDRYDLSYEIFRYGMIGFYTLQQQGKLSTKNLLSIIDFTKPSTKKRLYIIDLNTLSLKFCTYVSHGKNTGEDRAEKFSNVMHSNQSSIGFYLTAETYIGSKGYSLKLDGIEQGYNDNLRNRAVVIHEAEYVSENWIKQNGRLGRSQGCPALPVEISKDVIDTIKNTTPIFAYFNDVTYLNTSSYLSLDNLLAILNTTAQVSSNVKAQVSR